MANHISHASLPYPVKNARFTVLIPYLDADGDPTDPTTPDTEISIDGAAFTNTAEAVTIITGGRGGGYVTLSGAETNGSAIMLWAGAASGPKPTIETIPPRVLPILESGTAQSGAAGTITLAVAATSAPIAGCIVKTTGGTGGGGTGGANNQARVITAYNTSTKEASVNPNWEINPAVGTTYDILITDMAVTALQGSINLTVSALNDIKAEVIESIAVDTYDEPGQETPPSIASLIYKISYMYKCLINHLLVNTTTIEVYNKNATTVDHKSSYTNNGVVYDRGEFTSGP